MFFKFSTLVPIILILSIDILILLGLKSWISAWKKGIRLFFHGFFWGLSGLTILGLTGIIYVRHEMKDPAMVVWLYRFVGFFILLYLPKLIFLLFQCFHWLYRGVIYLGSVLLKRPHSEIVGTKGAPRGLSFLQWAGMGIGMVVFGFVWYGLTIGRHDFTVREVDLPFPDLPESFEGVKVLQISDFHIGSFWGNPEIVEEAVELINEQNPDFLVFTGDMVNNSSAEMVPFIDIVSRMKSKNGKYAILGNHDYGDYSVWSSREEKVLDHQKTIHGMEEMGFRMLLNEHVVLNRGGDSIFLVGVENWGKPPFPKYGNLTNAMKGIPGDGFVILLSHDPSHWEKEVLPLEKTVALTLSGHTHGFQFGLRLGSFQWSPVSWFYPRWGGVYQEEGRTLYINRGLGVIGFPGRIGMPPEITVLRLLKDREGAKQKNPG